MFIELYEMALALADDKSVSTCSFASFSLVRARACALRGYWGRMLRASALREADPLHQRWRRPTAASSASTGRAADRFNSGANERAKLRWRSAFGHANLRSTTIGERDHENKNEVPKG
jgi:hypothetical protein